jgi:succinyl-CoA synthetase alpha subunit
MILTSRDQVVVQGITGRQGSFWTRRMQECGTRIVAGVSPGKAGEEVAGVPVYDTVSDAASSHRIDATVLFVPPLVAKAAALEALASGVRNLVFLTEHVPYHDTMEVLTEARYQQARVLGPNTAGLVVPGEASVGVMPGFADNIFRPGDVGVISRSGSLGTLACFHIVEAGFGQSAFLGIGGDPIIGTTTLDALRILEADHRTRAIVLVGEIGGVMEEEAAAHIHDISKPVVALIAGRTAPPGRRMGHAGAIVMGDRGSALSKHRALLEAGVLMIDVLSDLGTVLRGFGLMPMVPQSLDAG